MLRFITGRIAILNFYYFPFAGLALVSFLLVECWWVAKALEIDGAEFLHGQATALCDFEFIESLTNGRLGDFDNINHFSDGPSKIVHASGQYQSSATYSSWPASRGHPIAVHPLNNSDGLISDSHCLVAKFQTVSKAKY